MPTFEPEASLRVWAVEVVLAERTLVIPALPAADWLPVLMTLDPMAVFDLVEGFDLVAEILAGVTLAELSGAAEEILEAATGRSARAALTIAGAAGGRWEVIGADLARVGVDFTRISIGAALDAIYGSIARHMDEKGIAQFNLMLDAAGSGSSLANAEPFGRERPKTVLLPRPDPPAGPSGPPTPQRLRPDGSGRRGDGALQRPGGGVGSPQGG